MSVYESIVADEIQEQCKTLLSEISEHMLKLSPNSRQAAQELADCLQRIRHKIDLRKQRNGWVKVVHAVTGNAFVYRGQMMMALYRYQVSAVLEGNEMMGQLLAGQTNISDQINEMVMPLMESLANLTSNIDSLTEMRLACQREEQTISTACQEKIFQNIVRHHQRRNPGTTQGIGANAVAHEF